MEQSGQASPFPCPRHDGPDNIRLVSVVYAEDAGGPLSPRPALKAADRLAWAGTTCGVAGMAAVWAGNVAGGSGTGIGLFCGIICFAYALALYGWAAARRSRLARVERGMPSALAVWRAAWYCDRCHGVFFSPDTAGTGARGLMSAAEFQRLVWVAGGYGDLSRAAP